MANLAFTDTNFQEKVLKNTLPVVVDFWAEWCPPCKMITPHIDELAQEYEGKVAIGKMNADENTIVPGQYNVMSLPTVLIFKDGKPIQSLIGAQSKQTFKSAIEKVFNT